MIRVTHLVPVLGVGGTEGVILDLCRHRSADVEAVVAVVGEPLSPIAVELRACGARVVSGVGACRAASASADLVNLHLWGYSREYVDLARRRPFVTTLHTRFAMPVVPAPVICTARHVHEIQPEAMRCVVIPNGIDVERFAAPERPVREEVVITRVCRPPRCAPYFWDIVHQVLRRFPQARFRVVGAEAQAPHPSGRVECLGVRRDVARILAESDLFLYTPAEGFGTKDLVVMEASAAGLPCVVSDVRSVRESVEEGRNGFRTPYGSVFDAVERLGRLIQDAELRRRMSEAAVRKARAEFDVRKVVARYEQVYRSVLGGAPARVPRRYVVPIPQRLAPV